jgi:hypothetical protein
LFVHPPYSPDLAPRDYHLFAYPKNWLGSWRFSNMRSWCKMSKHGWAHRRQTSLTRVHKNLLPARYNKCLNSSGDYIEK